MVYYIYQDVCACVLVHRVTVIAMHICYYTHEIQCAYHHTIYMLFVSKGYVCYQISHCTCLILSVY